MCEAAGKLGNTGLFLLPEVCGFPEVVCGFGDLLEKEQPLGSWAKR